MRGKQSIRGLLQGAPGRPAGTLAGASVLHHPCREPGYLSATQVSLGEGGSLVGGGKTLSPSAQGAGWSSSGPRGPSELQGLAVKTPDWQAQK